MTEILPLFDWDRDPESQPVRSIEPGGLEPDRTWTVSELTETIAEVLEARFPSLTLAGEVSGVSRPRSGHVYFKLKDEGAEIRAVLWREAAKRLAFDLEDGLAVKASGSIDLYAKRGEYQLNVRQIEPVGVGPLELAFRQLVDRLRAEGLFEAHRKRPLPRYPQRIGIVTSPTGAAIQDILQVLRRRWPCGEVTIIPAKVQGQGAAEQVAAAIQRANRLAELEVLIVGRGGGSLEDLWAFNEEVVARAIVASRLPIISAVGHEVDLTVADLVADRRALTPTEAAELVAPERTAMLQDLDRLEQRFQRAWTVQSETAQLRIEALAERAQSALRRSLQNAESELGRLASALEALSPLAVLARGYSLTSLEDRRTIARSHQSLQVGQLLVTRLSDGTVISRVEAIEPDESVSAG